MREISGNEIEIYEKIREKVFYYVMYQKRTEAEVKRKFSPIFKKYNISEETCTDLLEELKEKGYIDDKEFVRRKFGACMNFKVSSAKEIKYSMIQKGIPTDLIDQYMEENHDKIYQHEIVAAKRIYDKKCETKSDEEIKMYLRKKGFSEDAINELWESVLKKIWIYFY